MKDNRDAIKTIQKKYEEELHAAQLQIKDLKTERDRLLNQCKKCKANRFVKATAMVLEIIAGDVNENSKLSIIADRGLGSPL